jgi:hypothetical protein
VRRETGTPVAGPRVLTGRAVLVRFSAD